MGKGNYEKWPHSQQRRSAGVQRAWRPRRWWTRSNYGQHRLLRRLIVLSNPRRRTGFMQLVEGNAMCMYGVAQICNLPYRRFIIGRASESSSALALAAPSSGGPAEGGRAAECSSAIQQITNLRYEAAPCAKPIQATRFYVSKLSL